MSQVANLFIKNEFLKKKNFFRTLQEKPTNLSLLKFFLLLEQNKIAKFKICQYETNDFYIKTLKNWCIQYWFGFAGKLVLQGNVSCYPC